MLAKQAGARRPAAAQEAAAQRTPTFETRSQQAYQPPPQAPGWSGLAAAPLPVRLPRRHRRMSGNAPQIRVAASAMLKTLHLRPHALPRARATPPR